MNSDNMKQDFDSKVRLKTISRRPKVDERAKVSPAEPVLAEGAVHWHETKMMYIDDVIGRRTAPTSSGLQSGTSSNVMPTS